MSQPIKSYLLNLADDHLIIGHRNSEWTGIGPILEEDIAFSSIAQDKIGQAYHLFKILNEEFNMPAPDQNAFLRKESEYRCAHLVEHPIGEYDFSLVRHFYFEHAAYLRFADLAVRGDQTWNKAAKKFIGEIKYHLFHANTWIKQLADGTEESKARMQSALTEVFPLALEMFEAYPNEQALIQGEFYAGEDHIKSLWLKSIAEVIENAGLQMPAADSETNAKGGREGFHSEYLAPLLSEMSEVISIDPNAEW